MEDRIIEKREEATRLYERYGSLLTTTQQEVFSDYYLYDLSLSEIAENRGISRAAISDSLHKSMEKLGEFEAKLGLIKKEEEIKSLLEELSSDSSKTKDEALNIIKENI
ncbi:MAG: DNA-binding protein [Bacilli bacterium]|nr:DNA-binding protein [Bacilli bacterium]